MLLALPLNKRCLVAASLAGLSTSLSTEATHRTSEVKGTIRQALAAARLPSSAIKNACTLVDD